MYKRSASVPSPIANRQVLNPVQPPAPPAKRPLQPTRANSSPPPASGGPAKSGGSPTKFRLSSLLYLANRHTWRWQAAALCWLVLVVSLLGLLISFYVVNDRIQTFQQIEQVAVPSINAANQAEQSLAAEVSANASYILSDPATRQTLLSQIEQQRAEFERSLQTGYNSLATFHSTTPSVDSAFDYLNQHNQALQDAFAQARSLAKSGNQNDAVNAYLNGQNSYYNPIIFTLYYLRSIYINRLDDARTAATSANTLQLVLAVLIVIATAGLLLFVSLWLTLKVKRVLIPLVNLGFVLAAAYSAFLVLSLVNTGNDLGKVATAYNQASLLSDSQRLLTDAASDQSQWLIGGKVDTSGQFKGDELYAVDFKTQTGRLLTAPASSANSSQPIQPCPDYSFDRAQYGASGEMAVVCRNLLASDQLASWNNFNNAYNAWLGNDVKFRQLATGSKVSDALAYLNSNSVQNFNQMSVSLAQLRAANEQIYTKYSNDALSQLNVLSILTWAVYPIILVLGVVGLLSWRRKF